MSDALKRCPFCGGGTGIEKQWLLARIVCNGGSESCGACGPWTALPLDNAIAAWNQRVGAEPYLSDTKLEPPDAE